MKETTLYLKRNNNLLATECECPSCDSKYVYGVPYVSVPCNKCGITYKTDYKQTIFTKVAGRLTILLAHHDVVNIVADEEFYQSLATISDTYIRMGNWDVSDIEKRQYSIRYCEECGICHECLTCKDCQTTYKKNKHIRKQKCPECNSNNFTKTYFKNNETNICPHCGTKNIKHTLSKTKTKCHRCNTKNLTEEIVRNEYHLEIERKKSYMLNQL